MTTQIETDKELNYKASHAGPGMRLQEARVKAGLSVEEVASHLRLRVSVIEDLEEDRFENMAGLVFMRGYLRSYARSLNLDADKIVDMFNALNVQERTTLHNTIQSRQPLVRNERPVRWLMYTICLSCVVLALLWWNATKKNTIRQAQLNASTTEIAEMAELDAFKELNTTPKNQLKKMTTAALTTKPKGA